MLRPLRARRCPEWPRRHAAEHNAGIYKCQSHDAGFTSHANQHLPPNFFIKLEATDPGFDPDEADNSSIHCCRSR